MPDHLTDPELQDGARQLEDLLADAESLVQDLDDEAFRWRPAPGQWSISECLEHLSSTVESYAPRIEACIREGRQKGRLGVSKPKRGWIIGWLIKSMEPPVKRKFKAPPSFQPGEPVSKAEAYPRFVRLHRELAESMADADGLDLAKNRMASPVTSLLRMNLGEAFTLQLAHGRRHLWQARRVREQAGFPASKVAG